MKITDMTFTNVPRYIPTQRNTPLKTERNFEYRIEYVYVPISGEVLVDNLDAKNILLRFDEIISPFPKIKSSWIRQDESNSAL